jgi:hypothetical protein
MIRYSTATKPEPFSAELQNDADLQHCFRAHTCNILNDNVFKIECYTKMPDLEQGKHVVVLVTRVGLKTKKIKSLCLPKNK